MKLKQEPKDLKQAHLFKTIEMKVRNQIIRITHGVYLTIKYKKVQTRIKKCSDHVTGKGGKGDWQK